MERRVNCWTKSSRTSRPAGMKGIASRRSFGGWTPLSKWPANAENDEGGCVIGNLSASLSDTHDAFRRRLAECFDEMAQKFLPHLEAAARQGRVTRRTNTSELARYVVTVIEGAIMQARTLGDAKLLPRQLAYLKEHLKKCLEP